MQAIILSMYSGYTSLRDAFLSSSSVNFQDFCGLVFLSSNLFACSSGVISSQNFRTI